MWFHDFCYYWWNYRNLAGYEKSNFPCIKNESYKYCYFHFAWLKTRPDWSRAEIRTEPRVSCTSTIRSCSITQWTRPCRWGPASLRKSPGDLGKWSRLRAGTFWCCSDSDRPRCFTHWIRESRWRKTATWTRDGYSGEGSWLTSPRCWSDSRCAPKFGSRKLVKSANSCFNYILVVCLIYFNVEGLPSDVCLHRHMSSKCNVYWIL